jgi:hypothetical protein
MNNIMDPDGLVVNGELYFAQAKLPMLIFTVRKHQLGQVAQAGDAFDIPTGGAEGFGFHLEAPIIRGRIEDDRKVPVLRTGFELAKEFEAVHSGEGKIDDKALRNPVFQEFQCGHSVFDSLGLDAFSLKEFTEHLRSVEVVFDNQNSTTGS